MSFLIVPFFFIEIASSQVTAKVGDSVVVYRFDSMCPDNYSHPFSMTESITGQFGFTTLSDSTDYSFGFYFKPTAIGAYKDTIRVTYWCVDMQNDYMTGATYVLEAIATDNLDIVPIDAYSQSHIKVFYSTGNEPSLLFSCRRPEKIIIAVVDILGRTIKVFANEVVNVGEHHYSLDFPSGTYFARLQSESSVSSIKILVP